MTPMFHSQQFLRAPRLHLLVIALLATTVNAQVYRIEGADGRVTFSDRPLSSAAQSRENTAAPERTDSPSPSTAQLPYALRQSMSRYPVVLYTAKQCLPCDEARSFLQAHGVPFSERTVETPTDLDALKKLSHQENLPFATIGSQHLQGFAQDRWASYLKAAGYPAQSALPASYRPPLPQPLTLPAPPQQSPSATPAAPPNASLMSSPAPGAATPDNPAGLRF